MPFTLSHAAAALPLRRLNLVWSAFLVGSMAPDLPYITGSEYRELGHKFPGVLLFTLPASWIALWLFQTAIKKPVVGLLPLGVQQRLQDQLGDFDFSGIARRVTIATSLVLGIATHLVWDAFTHAYTWPWYRLGWLQSWIYVPFAGHMPMFMVLQYASTIIGMVALAAWILLWYRNTPPCKEAALPQPKSRVLIAFAICAVAAVAGFLRAILLVGGFPISVKGWDFFLMYVGVTALAVAFWELLLYCLLATSLRTWSVS